MSRGLGAMQRAILTTLDEARLAAPKYPGSGYSQAGLACSLSGAETPDAAGWLWVGRSCVLLAPEVYDMRCSSAYLARTTSKILYGRSPTSAFSAAFSRAVRGLVARHALVSLWMVPVAGWDRDYMRDQDLEWLADGIYFRWRQRQVRFVKRYENHLNT
ncbi:MAG TPA: hypothetical protein VLQ80_05790 [Candidatus Saccharimonadia bacterium]|nr:hypothetical protein [Candidatus Saccharimonadia bacterium]